MELAKLTITNAVRGLRAGRFSAVELTASCREAIRSRNVDLAAFLEIFEDAEEAAIAADHTRKELGDLAPPLLGIPLATKDNICIAGKTASAGSRMLEHYRAPYSATVVERLRHAGAIFLGRTNMDEFAMGSSTEHSAFGPTKNPHDLTRVPGGSSGGSAAAVGADMCLGALGSDTGGSIRQPASFCGIVGFKPSYGAVSRHGLIAMASSLDQIGPMTKSVADAKLLFHTIAGKDPFDATSREVALPTGDPEAYPRTMDLRIGVPREFFGEGLDPEVAAAIRAVLDRLREAGAAIEEISLPHASLALAAYYIIAPAEISSNLARFDGIRYGHRAAGAENLAAIYTRSRSSGFGSEVKRRIMLGTYTLSAGYYDAYYRRAEFARRAITDDFGEAFRSVDIILGPTTPTPAFALGARTEDPLAMYLADIYTVGANLAGLPALSLPVGTVPSGTARLPVGLQLIGKRFADADLLDTAEMIEAMLALPHGAHS